MKKKFLKTLILTNDGKLHEYPTGNDINVKKLDILKKWNIQVQNYEDLWEIYLQLKYDLKDELNLEDNENFEESKKRLFKLVRKMRLIEGNERRSDKLKW